MPSEFITLRHDEQGSICAPVGPGRVLPIDAVAADRFWGFSPAFNAFDIASISPQQPCTAERCDCGTFANASSIAEFVDRLIPSFSAARKLSPGYAAPVSDDTTNDAPPCLTPKDSAVSAPLVASALAIVNSEMVVNALTPTPPGMRPKTPSAVSALPDLLRLYFPSAFRATSGDAPFRTPRSPSVLRRADASLSACRSCS